MQLVREAWRKLRDPREAVEQLSVHSLETMLAHHGKLVVLSGILSGLASIVWALLRAAYLDFGRHIEIEYLRLINYYSGIAFGTFLFYIFAGTFLLFLVTVLVRIFIRDIPYWTLVKIFCIAFIPLALFGWISKLFVPGLLVWFAYLAVSGIRVARELTRKRSDPKRSR
jgi:hypothetical protein